MPRSRAAPLLRHRGVDQPVSPVDQAQRTHQSDVVLHRLAVEKLGSWLHGKMRGSTTWALTMKYLPGWLILLFSFVCGFTPQTVFAQALPDTLQVHFMDVGQGDSILIQTPDGATALIDGGYDNGLALAYLQQQGIQRLDAVIASHPHADHIGGLIEVMQAIPVDGMWTSGASHTTSYYERFLDTVDRQRIPYFEVGQGDTIPLGDLSLEVLHAQRRSGNLNNTSLVLRLQYGQMVFLFTGDAEAPAERQMLQTVPDHLSATVLKVGHHGSATSSTPLFLAVVQPQIAVYSAGRRNAYGHPHRQTLDNLAAISATVYGTAMHGTVVAETDGISLQVHTEYDVLPIQPDGASMPTSITPLPTIATTPGLISGYDPFGRDRNCGAFSTHADAQAFFIAAGGPDRDPHRLDGDNDGIACESLP